MGFRSNTPAPDSDAAYTAETERHYQRHLAASIGQAPSATVNDVAARPGVAQVGIFTGKGQGLTICIHGVSLRAVIQALTAIAEKGGA